MKKTIWYNAPEKLPNLGDEIIVAYQSDGAGQIKKELVQWTFKTNENTVNNKTKFRWFKVPPLTTPL